MESGALSCVVAASGGSPGSLDGAKAGPAPRGPPPAGERALLGVLAWFSLVVGVPPRGPATVPSLPLVVLLPMVDYSRMPVAPSAC